MRYYNLDANGRVLSHSRWPHSDWIELPDQPSEFHAWDGAKWVEDEQMKESARRENLKRIALDEAQRRVVNAAASSVLSDIKSGVLRDEKGVRESDKYSGRRIS